MAKRQQIPGVVDRIEGDNIVIVIKDPDDGINKEIHVNKKRLTKAEFKKGDELMLEMSMIVVKKKDTVNLIFSGVKSEEMAKRFYTYLVDGGLEDHLIETLSEDGVTLEIVDYNNKKLTVLFRCSKEKPVNKAVKKPVKKTVKKV